MDYNWAFNKACIDFFSRLNVRCKKLTVFKLVPTTIHNQTFLNILTIAFFFLSILDLDMFFNIPRPPYLVNNIGQFTLCIIPD